MGTVETRRAKIEWMQNSIGSYLMKYPTGWVSRKKLVARCAIKYGCSPRTASEIINILEDANFIQVKGDEITKWMPKKF